MTTSSSPLANRGSMKSSHDLTLYRSCSPISEWKSLQLGNYKSGDDLFRELNLGGFLITDGAADILEKTQLAMTRTQISTVKVSLWQLGLSADSTAYTIHDRAAQCGFDTVPAEVGPQLRLQYVDQPPGEYLLVGMDPISLDGYPSIFAISHDCGRCLLDADCGYRGHFWSITSRWVFARRVACEVPE